MSAITYQKNIQLCKPVSGERIPEYSLAYMNERHRNNVHSFILGCLRESGITQAELARRLGKKPELISRKIGSPGNWTLDSVSELLFAINGCEPSYSVRDVLSLPKKNFGPPDWLHSLPDGVIQLEEFRRNSATATEPKGKLEMEIG